jgi:hypothetical protein
MVGDAMGTTSITEATAQKRRSLPITGTSADD